MKILLIDDDYIFASNIQKALKRESFCIDYVDNSRQGLTYAIKNNYDLILLDINLPLMDGFEICKTLRNSNIKIPIIFLTEKNEVSNKLNGFYFGCDDYISKPFNIRELVARIMAISRRSTSNCIKYILTYKDLTVDLFKHQVIRGDDNVNLTKKEFMILELLMKNSEQVISRDEIFDKVWDENSNPFTNIVEVYINKLREKIDLNKEPLINNIQGVGYYLGKKRY